MHNPVPTQCAYRVLLVGANAEERTLEQQALEQMSAPVHVAVADSARAALAELSQEVYDLVVTECCLRDLSGLALLRLARQGGIATPFLLLAEADCERSSADALTNGASHCVLRDHAHQYLRSLPAVALSVLQKCRLQREVKDLAQRVDTERQTLAALRAEHEALQQEDARQRTINAPPRETSAPRAQPEWQSIYPQALEAERLRLLGLMATGIGHNLNNELNGIIPYLELLLTTKPLEPDVRDMLRMIHRSATNAASIVQRMTNFARHSPHASFVALNPNEMIEEALLLARHKWKDWAARRGIAIEVKTVFAPVPYIIGNLSDLHSVLTNLIINAVDAMPQGGTLTLRTRTLTHDELRAVRGEERASAATDDPRPAPPCWVTIEIADTGVGMSAEVKQRIFEPFFSTKGAGGTGLGLSVSAQVMAQHQGDILVHTQEGQGSTFTLLFPAFAPQPPPTASET